MKNKLLSVVVPAYNVEKYLNKSIESLGKLLNCDDVEIFIINDGSTDCTLQRAIQLKKLYKNITVIDKRNTGLSSTRNLGNQISTGEYIYFFDSDDYLNSEYISDIMKELNKKYVDIICFGYAKVDGKGKNLSNHVYNNNEEFSKINYFEFIRNLVGDNNEAIAGYLPTKIIRHKLIKNIRFKQMNYEDMPFIFELLSQYKIDAYYFNKIVYNYVQHIDSITHSNDENNMLDKLKSLDIVAVLLDKIGVNDEIKYLNYKRTLVATLWISSLNDHGKKYPRIAYDSNIQFNKLPFLLNKHVGITVYMYFKEMYYLFKNKLICRRSK